MKNYSYQASDKNGKVISGSFEASSEQDVIFNLRSKQLYPISIKESGGSKKSGEKEGGKFTLELALPFTGINSKDVLYFTEQLSKLIAAGLTIDKSLAVLKEVNEKPKFNTVIDAIHHSVHGGDSFAEALAKHPKVFSKLYISMIKAGEASGILDKILVRLSSFLEKSQHLKDSILSALIYPILLVFVGGAAVAILMTFVIPKFVTIFEDMGTEIPLPTLILLNISNFISEWWWALIILAVLFVVFLQYLLTFPNIRFSWDSFKFRSPLFGTLIQKIEVARFTRTFGTLISSGVPILQALTIVKETVTNAKIASSIDPVYEKVKDGSGVAEPLDQERTFPIMAIQMIKVGEETGQLESMLLKVAETYEAEVEKTVKALISLLEPLMILTMGGVVGAIVISMLMAIFSINDISF